MAIENRYEFMYYLSCVDANPNGDPDMGNAPRTDSDTMQGIITDVATKRRIRDYVAMFYGDKPGMDIFVQQGVNLNRLSAEAKEAAGIKLDDKDATTSGKIDVARAKACERFWDVRTFGAVMSTGPNCGQVRGPVQLAFGRSLDSVQPMDMGITRVACTDNIANAKTAQDYKDAEAKTEADKLRTMGRKQYIPYGLYEIHGFISARLAEQTGFDEKDLEVLFKAIANMYDATRTASKGTMSVVSPLIIFKHVGDQNCPAEEARNQALLGRAPAYKLFELVSVSKKPDVIVPRGYRDYDASINLSGRPDGVNIGFLMPYADNIVWNALPVNNDWLKIM